MVDVFSHEVASLNVMRLTPSRDKRDLKIVWIWQSILLRIKVRLGGVSAMFPVRPLATGRASPCASPGGADLAHLPRQNTGSSRLSAFWLQ